MAEPRGHHPKASASVHARLPSLKHLHQAVPTTECGLDEAKRRSKRPSSDSSNWWPRRSNERTRQWLRQKHCCRLAQSSISCNTVSGRSWQWGLGQEMGWLLVKIWPGLLPQQRSHWRLLQRLNKDLSRSKRLPLWLHGAQIGWSIRHWPSVHLNRLPEGITEEGHATIAFQELSGRHREAQPKCQSPWRGSAPPAPHLGRSLREEVDEDSPRHHVPSIQ